MICNLHEKLILILPIENLIMMIFIVSMSRRDSYLIVNVTIDVDVDVLQKFLRAFHQQSHPCPS
jgi:hypothetical protein